MLRTCLRYVNGALRRRPLLTGTAVLVTPVLCWSAWTRTDRPAACGRTNHLSRWQRLFSATSWEIQNAADIAEYIKNGTIKKVVVMVGAGISTPSGIPDFRTPGTGLYDNLQKYDLPYPEAVFDIDYFHVNPKPFFSLARELYPGQYKPNVTHYFMKLLHDKGLLHRLYTQNIDGLERLAGIPAEKMVEAHGTFHSATCRICYKSYKGIEIQDSILKGEIPRCTRSLCNGVIKPDIVFFGEQLPASFFMFTVDMPRADLLLVMGSSLEVQPFAGISEATLPGVPRLLFNREIAGSFLYSPRKHDVVMQGDLVERVWEFATMLGWKDELQELIDNHENERR